MEIEDYRRATFPMDLTSPSGRSIRLLGVIGDRIIGAVWHGESIETAWSVQALTWNGNGQYSDDGHYPEMDLPPPPSQRIAAIAALRQDIAIRQARLDANPDAPDEWRNTDMHQIRLAEAKIAALNPSAYEAMTKSE
jgi:hypothetical protein